MHANKTTIYCISDACKGYNIDECKEIYKKFEYEKINLILSTSPELATIAEKDYNSCNENPIADILAVKSMNKYQINANPLGPDEKPWVDKKNKFTTIPSMIMNCFFISGYQADRTNTANDFLLMRSKCRCSLFILWPNHNKHPNWLNKNFQFLHENVGTDHPTICFELWQKNEIVCTGEDFVFGGSEGILADNNTNSYVICLREETPEISDIRYAIYYESDEIVKRLLDKITNSNDAVKINGKCAPLDENLYHCAVKSGRSNIVDLLFNYEIGMNIQNIMGDTPLHLACRLNRTEVYIYIIFKRIIFLLLFLIYYYYYLFY